jgi:maltooligosyltrehalose trehalohydrolase
MMSRVEAAKSTSETDVIRRLPVGAETQPDGSTHFRVWAPRPSSVSLVLYEGGAVHEELSLEPEGDGYRSVRVGQVGDGAHYRYRLDGSLFADPASRYQPEGPFGPSQVVDPARFQWSDAGWRGAELHGQIVYELHVGTFTQTGTWRSAAERLPHLVTTGVSLVEVMPVAEFPGRFGWGYDGVLLYAPTRLYGTPDDFRFFVDRAHALGLGVILDVVYNHLGPDGAVHHAFSADYFNRQGKTEWGDGLNFDGPASAPVREYFACNASYWIAEYHLDGLRLDATQSIADRSKEHLLTVISRQARAAAVNRSVLLVSENEPEDVTMVRPIAHGGHGLDAMWNDDFHHSAFVALTGRREAYYSDHRGRPQEFVSAAKYGFLFQGQRYAWQGNARGSRTDGIAPAVFVAFIENHDQVANSGDGTRLRLQTAEGRYRAMTALLLLMPGTPMLFQGQEFGASSPFLFFADHNPELAAAVRKGRGEFLAQFPSLASAEMRARLPAPEDPATFERCKLRWEEMGDDNPHWRLHRDLIALRRGDTAFQSQRRGLVDGAVLEPEAFVLRFTGEQEDDERMLIINLGLEIVAASLVEPLIAPPGGSRWEVRWSSEHPDYGGTGTADVVSASGWRIPGHAAVVLRPVENDNGGSRAV